MKLLDKLFKRSEEVDTQVSPKKAIGLEIKFPGCDEFVPIGKDQVKRIYSDDLGP